MTNSSAPPGGGGFGDFVGDGGETAARARKRPSRKAVLVGCSTGALLLCALTGAAMAGSVQASTDEAVQPAIERIDALDERTAAAKEELAGLPTELSAGRAFESATKSQQRALEAQESFWTTPERKTTDRFGEVLPEAEQETQAAADRRVHGDASRVLSGLFDQSAETASAFPGSEPVDASAPWFGGIKQDAGWRIEAVAPLVYDAVGKIPATWLVRSADGTLLGTVQADWDTTSQKFSVPMLLLTDEGSAILDAIEQAELDAARSGEQADGDEGSE